MGSGRDDANQSEEERRKGATVIGLREINKRMSTEKSEVGRESMVRGWMSIEWFLQFINARIPITS